MARVVLIVPSATYKAQDFLAASARLGVDVVVASEHASVLSQAGDGRSLVVKCDDPGAATDSILELDRTHPIDAVVAVDEQGVGIAAMASEALGLPHSPPSAVAATRDKLALRQALASAEVPQAAWAEIGEGDSGGEALAEIGYPCVIKPRSLSASRGVIRADTQAQAEAAIARSRRIVAASGGPEEASLVVESYIPGIEVALDAILAHGQVVPLAMFDKPDPLEGPYFEETIYVTPSRVDPAIQAQVLDVVARAARAVGLTHGPIHAEARIDAERVYCIEVAARSIGGHCSRSLSFGGGVSLEEVVLASALGLKPPPTDPTYPASGVMMIPIPATGAFVAVSGEEAARSIPGIVGVEIAVPIGSEVVGVPEGDRYLGFIFARASSARSVEASLRKAHSLLGIKIDPAPPQGDRQGG